MRQQETHLRDTVLLSGWLFADLLLGLMVVFLISTPGSAAVIATPTLRPTATYTVLVPRTPRVTVVTPGAGTGVPLNVTQVASTKRAEATATPVTPTRTPTLTPTPTPTPPCGLSKEPITITLNSAVNFANSSTATYGQARDALIDQIKTAMVARGAERAGLVETFGFGEQTVGNRIAGDINHALLEGSDAIIGQAIMKKFHDLTGNPSGGADSLMYVYVHCR